jgi:uncharacterized membrane protein
LAVGLLAALVLLGLAWELHLAPTGGGGWAVKVLPLALMPAGLLKLKLASYRVLSLLVWLYVAEGLVRGTSEAGLAQALAWAQVALALALFAACVWHVRLRVPGRSRRKEAS